MIIEGCGIESVVLLVIEIIQPLKQIHHEVLILEILEILIHAFILKRYLLLALDNLMDLSLVERLKKPVLLFSTGLVGESLDFPQDVPELLVKHERSLEVIEVALAWL